MKIYQEHLDPGAGWRIFQMRIVYSLPNLLLFKTIGNHQKVLSTITLMYATITAIVISSCHNMCHLQQYESKYKDLDKMETADVHG